MHDLDLGKKIACTEAEKAQCRVIVFLLLSFAEQVRNEGLQSLAGPAKNHKLPAVLRRGLEFLAGQDEIQPETLEDELARLLDPGDAGGRELLERVLVLQGLIYITRGASHEVLFEKLAAYFGEGYYDTLRTDIRSRFERIRRSRQSDFQPDAFLETLRNTEVLIPETGHLETITAKLTDADVDYILVRSLDVPALNNSLSGASGTVQIRFLERLAPGRLLEFKKEREAAGAQPPYVLEEDQLAFVERIREFARAGELSFQENEVRWPGE